MRGTVLWQIYVFILKLSFLYAFNDITESARQHEKRLLYDLFNRQNYQPLVRPVKSLTDTVEVELNLQVSQIINIDEKNQIMKANVWSSMYWNDTQLQWNPNEYGGITKLSVPSSMLWTPDIVLFNNADGKYEVSYKCNCVVYNNGHINWIPPAIYKSSCKVNVRYFPFDEQVCAMKFGSWTYRREQLRFIFRTNRTTAVLDDYLKSGTWDLMNCSGKILDYIDMGENRTLIVYEFYIRRKTLFYTITLIIPCILISFVTISVFALPADACEKITLCISILVALVVFMLLVSKILPPSVTIPLISKYLLFTFIMNVFAILITVIVINRNYRTPHTHRMPNWVRYVFLKCLPRFLLMKRPDHEERWTSKQETKKTDARSRLTSAPGEPHGRYNVPQPSSFVELCEIPHSNCRLRPRTEEVSKSRETLTRNSLDTFPITPELRRAVESVKYIAQHLRQEDAYETVREDWKYMALVLDRLVLYIFVIVTVSMTCSIFMEAPNIFVYVDQDKIIADLMGVTTSDS